MAKTEQIVIPVTPEVKALAEATAKTLRSASGQSFKDASEWGEEWLRNSLMSVKQQEHQAKAASDTEKAKRQIDKLFDGDDA